MLILYNKEHEAIGALTNLKDYKIEYVLSGEDLLGFSLSICDENIHLVEEEGYVRNKNNEYVIKAMDPSDNFKRFTCNVNVEDIVGKAIANFDTSNNKLDDTIRLAIAGTGWTLVDSGITKRRTVRLTNTNALEVLREVRKVFSVDFRYDAINKKIYVYEKFGEDKGVYFSDELNLKTLSIPSDTYDYVTRLYPYGKDGLTISEINNGKEYIENFQYSNKIIELIWQDNRYTDVNSLKEDAEAKLEELSKPKRSYQTSVTDLAKQSDEYSYLDFFLGDTVTLLSKSEKFRDKQRIVKYIEYPDNPSENTCELGNTILTFEELQQENEYKNQTVDNITTGNGTVNGEAIDGISTDQIYDFEAEVAKITDLTVISAEITNLKAENVTITGKLSAIEGEFGTLKANVGVIDKLVVSHSASINELQANKADITDLTATNIKFDVASGGTLDLQTLLSKFITGENGQFINISSSNSVIANATIKNAMIESLSLDKLLAGRISTNKFTVSSDDGGIEIVGATQQFKDKNNKVRIQMGQDTQGNFNFILRGEDGTTTLIDHTGIKENAIADDLIKENMVAADAIGEKQINYSSLITGLNKDTNTQLIKASKVAIDLTGQSLEVAFNSLKTNVDGLDDKIESNTTAITVAQGKIEGLISENSIIKGDVTTISDKYTSLKATVDSINATVASHTSSIGTINTNINGLEGKVTTVENKYTSLNQNLEGFKTTVGNTYSTKSELSNLSGTVSSINSRVSTAEASISQLNNKIALKVEATDVTEAINNISIGGRNLQRYTDFTKEENCNTWTIWGTGRKEFNSTDNSLKIISTGTTTSNVGVYQKNPSNIGFEQNKIYTVSLSIKGIGVTSLSYIYIMSNESGVSNQSLGKSISILDNTWSNISFTIIPKVNYPKGQIMVATSMSNGNGIEIKNLKVEKGNKATDWTPAPEDVDSAITAVDTKITTTNNKVASIETNLSSITNRVSSVENNVSTIDGNVTSLQSRMSSAELKITDKAIINTISSQFYNKDETDNKYATQAQLTQTVKDFTFKFSESGGYNLIRNSSGYNGTVNWTASGLSSTGTFTTTASTPTGRGIYIDNGTKTTESYIYSSRFRLSPNTTYTLKGWFNNYTSCPSFDVFVLSSTSLDETSTDVWSYTNAHHLINADTNGSWKEFTVTFTTPASTKSGVLRIDNNGYDSSQTTANRVYFSSLILVEGEVGVPWSPHPNEVYDGVTTIDKNGVTVTNGGLTIKNNAGTRVFYGDTNGNLTLAGNITSGATITGGTLKSSNGDMVFNMNSGYMLLYNNGTKIGQTNKNNIAGTSIYGVTNGAEYGNYSCLAAKTSSSASVYTMMMTASGSDLTDYIKKGVNIGQVLNSNNWDFNLGTSTYLRWKQSGAIYESFITEGSEGMLRMYGDNGAYIGYRVGETNTYIIAIRESGSHTYPKSLSIFNEDNQATDSNGYSVEINAPIKMNGQSINECSNIKTLGLEIVDPVAFYSSDGEQTRTYGVTKNTQEIIEFIGSVEIINGEATVSLPKNVVFKNYVVVLSPIGLNRNVSLIEKNDDNFKISGDDGLVDYIIKFESVDYTKYLAQSFNDIDNIDVIERSEEDKPKEILLES